MRHAVIMRSVCHWQTDSDPVDGPAGAVDRAAGACVNVIDAAVVAVAHAEPAAEPVAKRVRVAALVVVVVVPRIALLKREDHDQCTGRHAWQIRVRT